MLESSNVIVSAHEGARLVGFLRGFTDGAHDGFICDLAVHPDYQKRGIGVELMRLATSKHPEVQWVLPVAPTLDDSFEQGFLDGLPVKLLRDRGYAARAFADAALVASGTATLETALLGTPFAIVYRLNPLTYQAAKHLVKLPRIGLANVVAGREVAPELLQSQVNPLRLSATLTRLLDPVEADRLREGLASVRPHLGEPGAAGRVAEHLLNHME